MHTKSNRFSWLFLVLVPAIMLVLVPAAQAEGRSAPLPPPGGKYTVRVNDTLWDIATRYGMTVAQLSAANPDVTADALRPGQILTIASETQPVSGAVYSVRPNDTLWDISSRYGLFVNDLLAANPGVDPQRLMAGQTLLIPGTYGKAAPAAASGQISAKYTVRTDDTLWDIAANYGLYINDVLAANPGVDPRRLRTGQELTIPGISQEMLSTEAAAPAAPPPAPEAAPISEPAAAPGSDAPPAPAVEAAPALEATPASAPEIGPMAQEMLTRINEKRTAGGLPALAWNGQLAAAAQAHAAECAARNRGSHVGSDGARLVTRLQRAGYAPSWSGENWANARSVVRAMEMWWNEPPGADPHVQNIMARGAAEIGLGVAKGAWGYYFIADFGCR